MMFTPFICLFVYCGGVFYMKKYYKNEISKYSHEVKEWFLSTRRIVPWCFLFSWTVETWKICTGASENKKRSRTACWEHHIPMFSAYNSEQTSVLPFKICVLKFAPQNVWMAAEHRINCSCKNFYLDLLRALKQTYNTRLAQFFHDLLRAAQ